MNWELMWKSSMVPCKFLGFLVINYPELDTGGKYFLFHEKSHSNL